MWSSIVFFPVQGKFQWLAGREVAMPMHNEYFAIKNGTAAALPAAGFERLRSLTSDDHFPPKNFLISSTSTYYLDLFFLR